MKGLELKKGIYWVGVVDWNIRDFHGYKTPNGTTYNAYLVVDEKIALIDTVKRQFLDELIDNVREIVDLEKIDYLIVNHVEMDHSGSFPEVVKKMPNAKILATKEGKNELIKHFGNSYKINTVDSGDTLSLGKKTLSFIKTPMLHWPDSMFTYVVEDKVLFSSDAFGQHYASSYRFDDEVDKSLLHEAAGDYFANILWLYSPLILRLIENVQSMGIEIEMIAPDHGFIWRDNPLQVVEWYAMWSQGDSKDKVVIVYDTMWGSTEKMAKGISKGISEEGVEVKLLRIRNTYNSYIIKELLDSRGILVGTPTLNNGMFPVVGGFLTYLKGLRPKKKIGACFGSYGWGGGACASAQELVELAGIEVVSGPLELQWVPTIEEIKKCREFGKEFAKKVKEQARYEK
ncbi:MAG: FprA family A-type flavoprotein [Candidatus Methanofastidiosia archaeon]